MIVIEGYFYHIKDEYFDAVNDGALMSNYEDGGYRPHYFAIRNNVISEIFWMIPVSSKYEKYQKIYDKIVERHRRCTKIVLGKCGGRDAAYLIQNAFPITSDYLDHVHTLHGSSLNIHSSTERLIVRCFNNNMRLHKRGVHLFFTDIDRLFQLMENHLNETKQ